VMGVAPIVAPLVGGALLTIAGWRAIFFLLVAAGTIGFVGVRATLPETAPPRAPGPRVGLLRSLVSDRDFVVYAVIAATASAGLFAYITGVPRVLLDLHHVAPRHFGWYFGTNAAGYVAMCQINARLVRRHAPLLLLRRGMVGLVGAPVLLIAGAMLGWPLWVTAASYFLFLSSLGLVFPNAIALALEHQAARAGSAAAWIGAAQFGLAAGASSLVSAWNDGTALPPSAVMLGFGGIGATVLIASRRR